MDENNLRKELQDAIRTNDYDLVKNLLELKADPNIQFGVFKMTALHGVNNVNIASLLLEFKADPNIMDTDGFAPLHYISDFNAMTRLLLERNADPNLPSRQGFTPLQFASTPEIAQTLLEHGAIVGADNESDERMFEYHRMYGRLHVIERIKIFMEYNQNILIKAAR